jgi:hypothetical protein
MLWSIEESDDCGVHWQHAEHRAVSDLKALKAKGDALGPGMIEVLDASISSFDRASPKCRFLTL